MCVILGRYPTVIAAALRLLFGEVGPGLIWRLDEGDVKRVDSLRAGGGGGGPPFPLEGFLATGGPFPIGGVGATGADDGGGGGGGGGGGRGPGRNTSEFRLERLEFLLGAVGGGTFFLGLFAGPGEKTEFLPGDGGGRGILPGGGGGGGGTFIEGGGGEKDDGLLNDDLR